MIVEDDGHPITEGWAGLDSFEIDDEWYRWRTARGVEGITQPRGLDDTHVLLSLDETTVSEDVQGGDLPYPDSMPIAWTKTFRGGGRVYYNNMGHSAATWAVPEFLTSIVNGIAWVSEVPLDAECYGADDRAAAAAAPPAPDRRLVGEACTLPDLAPRAGGTWETSGPPLALTEDGGEIQLNAGIPGGFGWGAQTYVLDLSASGAATADLSVDLAIPVPTDDYDLSITTGWGWYGAHSLPGATSEHLDLTNIPHCAVLHMYADNAYAPSQAAPTLTVEVTPGAPLPPAGVTRLAAASGEAADVAAAWSGQREDVTCACAFLARDDDFADALASGGAQGATGGPLLLTDSSALSEGARAELQRLQVERVTILGGEQAVVAGVVAELEALGIAVDRLAGATRIETAIAIAEAFPQLSGAPLLVRAYQATEDPTTAFADSLAAGREAAASGRPVLLTTGEALSPAVAAYLEDEGVEALTVVGGTAAVSDAVLDALREAGIEPTRVAGSDRAGTAIAVATQLSGAASAADAQSVVLIEGFAPDAWVDGFAAAGHQPAGPIVLASGPELPDATAAWLQGGAGDVPLLCGARITPAACDAAAAALGLT